jgi:hypothetical protein
MTLFWLRSESDELKSSSVGSCRFIATMAA